ncbi:Cell wall-associated hydrolase, NlpC family [Thermosyntropha lipolytica DSM 11003]|uniref:Cell wall-associated hydrolase, NlpC family n=1 Tax=Thermosyntropha lipolytica DSM 11003 TaxID=1123382 RepID=A0A1M5QFX4_9FIRM|nr:C40 family peptidase [Thermosyntropha lipolytica]SHH12746.1 Cell wall-associated hydrolase, NlpC family [Thermosyntropha lipolytica DSM 11003]
MGKKVKILVITVLFIFLGCVDALAAEEIYTVKAGDSLWKIASRYGLTVEKLKQINNLTSDRIFPGQALKVSSSIPSGQNAEQNADNNVSSEQASDLVYIVKAGDNLWKIARDYGTTVEELKRLNNLASDRLNVGDKLLVRGVVRDNITPSRSGNLIAGERIIEFASRYLGTPYRYGGNSPGGFDCSGFVYYVFDQFGISLPRTAAGQFQNGVAVSREELMVGDLVFFSCYSKGIDHVGIYVGEGRFIHSSSPRSGGVIYSSLNEAYYARSYVGAKRILR